jgi:diketogulonate reductase-like aldo/keto reductase
MTRDKARKSVETSLNDLGIDYLDLLLIHWPCVDGVDPKDGKTLQAARL